MISNINDHYYTLFDTAKHELPFMVYILAIVWFVNIINWLLKGRLNIFGIYPRTLWGLIGIIFSPILHANFNHLFFNSIPFFVLGMFLLALGKDMFVSVSIFIILFQGISVWLFGRKSIHIGASGLISGYFGFLLGLSYFHPTVVSVILAFVLLYYFGTIILGILPTSERVSWESHLSGMMVGITLIYLLYTFPQYETLFMQIFS